MLTSTEAFDEVLDFTRKTRLDALLMAGDCVDYISDANIAQPESRPAALTDGRMQYVSALAFEGYAREVPVCGE